MPKICVCVCVYASNSYSNSNQNSIDMEDITEYYLKYVKIINVYFQNNEKEREKKTNKISMAMPLLIVVN